MLRNLFGAEDELSNLRLRKLNNKECHDLYTSRHIYAGGQIKEDKWARYVTRAQ
jgi:hypothetical protein